MVVKFAMSVNRNVISRRSPPSVSLAGIVDQLLHEARRDVERKRVVDELALAACVETGDGVDGGKGADERDAWRNQSDQDSEAARRVRTRRSPIAATIKPEDRAAAYPEGVSEQAEPGANERQRAAR